MKGTLQDLHHGIRLLTKAPGFTLAAVVTLALAIGANTSIFTVVNSVLLQPLRYAHPDRLVVLWESNPSRGIERENLSPANFRDFERQGQSFQQMAAAHTWSPNLTGFAPPEKLRGLRVSANLFGLLGVNARLGRTFLPVAEDPGEANEVVLGYGLWQRRFAGDNGVLGKKLILDGQPFTVVGVMPPDFGFPPFWATDAELWAPLAFDNTGWSQRNARMLRGFARLRDGVSIEQAHAEVQNIASRLARDYPDSDTGLSATLVPLKEMVVGRVRPALLVLQVAVGFLLLVACANVANMLLARAIVRQKEFAIRVALGAERQRVFRQMLVETLVLAVVGGALGTALSVWGVDALLALLPQHSKFALPRAAEIAIDSRVLGFALVLSLVTAIVSTLFVAGRTWRSELSQSLRNQERLLTQPKHTLRSALVVAQVAMSLLLIIGSGLLAKSFMRLLQVNPGFDPQNVLTMCVAGPEGEGPRKHAFYDELLHRVRALPGVQSASAINHLPLAGDQWGTSFTISGTALPAPGERPRSTWRVVDPDYFATMHIPLRKGRYFSDRDGGLAPRVVIVNEALAQRHFLNEDPLGKRIKFGDPSGEGPEFEIVGVVADVKQVQWVEPPAPELYVPMAQNDAWSMTHYMTLIVRGSSDPGSLTGAIRNQVWSVYKDAPIYDVLMMDQVAADAVSQPRFLMLLLVLFSVLALTLAAIGIYAVVSHSISARTRDFGIRIALGADRGRVLFHVLRHGFKLTILGVTFGVVAGLVLSRFVSSLIYEVKPADTTVFVISVTFLTAVSLFACYIPARRAMSVDPAVALRHD